MRNENRLIIMGTLFSPLIVLIGILYNSYGDPKFRDVICAAQIFIAIISIALSYGVFRRYFILVKVPEVSIPSTWKCVCSLFIICLNLYLLYLLNEFSQTKGINIVDIKIDMQWHSYQFGILIVLIGAAFDSLIDEENMLIERFRSRIVIPLFGEIACNNGYLTDDQLNEILKEINEWKQDIEGEIEDVV